MSSVRGREQRRCRRPVLRAITASGACLALASCGSSAPATNSRHGARYPVELTASFPGSQRLAQRSALVISVRNAGVHTIPDVAVTITDPRRGTAVQPFATDLQQRGLASHSRAVWIVDTPPGGCGFSCRAGGPGGAVTSYSNTWALGRLAPGAAAVFRWGVTAVQTGTFRLRYGVAPALSGGSVAVLANAAPAVGTLAVAIHGAPTRSYVNDAGQIVHSN
jgi:hypothetical protein